jgi:glycosyltransferase involved in cell wall biosynthesis
MLINVTLPVYNEEAQVASSARKVVAFLEASGLAPFEVVVADNGSTDRTLEVATRMAREHTAVRIVRLEEKGRGRAVRKVWSESTADILSYMDIDLSTDLGHFPDLIGPLAREEFDIATGSRLHPKSATQRGLGREVLSRGYNFLVKALFGTRFTDAQCGFKAITRASAAELLPFVEDNHWFFDTELLVLAERLGRRVHDLPVRWVDDPDSRVKILRTVMDDLKGLARLRRNLAGGKHEALRRAGRKVERV